MRRHTLGVPVGSIEVMSDATVARDGRSDRVAGARDYRAESWVAAPSFQMWTRFPLEAVID